MFREEITKRIEAAIWKEIYEQLHEELEGPEADFDKFPYHTKAKHYVNCYCNIVSWRAEVRFCMKDGDWSGLDIPGDTDDDDVQMALYNMLLDMLLTLEANVQPDELIRLKCVCKTYTRVLFQKLAGEPWSDEHHNIIFDIPLREFEGVELWTSAEETK